MLFSYPILVLKTKLLIAKFSRNSFLRQLQNLKISGRLKSYKKIHPAHVLANCMQLPFKVTQRTYGQRLEKKLLYLMFQVLASLPVVVLKSPCSRIC